MIIPDICLAIKISQNKSYPVAHNRQPIRQQKVQAMMPRKRGKLHPLCHISKTTGRHTESKGPRPISQVSTIGQQYKYMLVIYSHTIVLLKLDMNDLLLINQ